jgi:hypothetical protein
MLAKGDGRLNKASLAIDTLPSLRPVGTSQCGPPICTEKLVKHRHSDAVNQW